MIYTQDIPMHDGVITLEVGKLAPLCDVSILAKYGETEVLVTLAIGPDRTDIDYFPLTVEYAEKLYAGGIIKGSRWVKREGRPSDEATLIARLIDRGVRPLFPKHLHCEVQIIITLLALDNIHSPDVVSSIAVSAALCLSSLPWNGPVATTRIGIKKDGDSKQILNPLEEDQENLDLDLIVTSTDKKVVMIEAGANAVSNNVMFEAIKSAHEQNIAVTNVLKDMQKKAGKEKTNLVTKDFDSLYKDIKKDFSEELNTLAVKRATDSRKNFDESYKQLVEKIYEKQKDIFSQNEIKYALYDLMNSMLREDVMKSKKRFDGRAIDEIRPLLSEVGILPRTHGTGLFQRGQTQVLSIATLGPLGLEQYIESPEGKEEKRYLHHYYMPPYSVGEVGRLMGPSRREIGHGALAEKALLSALPPEEDFPYVIRIVSEVLSSNGSTSMASTCGSTLALLDAGVPLKYPVAGISIGMVSNSDSDYVLLTDIAGIEDFAGDMDFKVAGNETGITAIQLDVKNDGLTTTIIQETLERAYQARLKVLEVMKTAISSPRTAVSQYAPKVVVLIPPADKIGEIIGPGGKNIRHISSESGAEINITDDGKVSISAIDNQAVKKAENMIKEIYRVMQVGEVYEGKVVKILAFGAIVELPGGKDGMIHVSNLGKGFVKRVEDVVRVGDEVTVKVVESDPERGRVGFLLVNNKSFKGKVSLPPRETNSSDNWDN